MDYSILVKDGTTIAISKRTKDKLKDLKQKKESFEEILERLIAAYSGTSELEELSTSERSVLEIFWNVHLARKWNYQSFEFRNQVIEVDSEGGIPFVPYHYWSAALTCVEHYKSKHGLQLRHWPTSKGFGLTPIRPTDLGVENWNSGNVWSGSQNVHTLVLGIEGELSRGRGYIHAARKDEVLPVIEVEYNHIGLYWFDTVFLFRGSDTIELRIEGMESCKPIGFTIRPGELGKPVITK